MEYEATHLTPTNDSYAARSEKLKQELAVHSSSQWKGAFVKLMTTVRNSVESLEIDYTDDSADPGVILNACCEDMIKLWSDPTLQGILRAHNVRLEDKSGL
jgi:guanine nucleotide-binding protein subunit alpha